jgi:D-alanyl-D-alanine carboxypeptidase
MSRDSFAAIAGDRRLGPLSRLVVLAAVLLLLCTSTRLALAGPVVVFDAATRQVLFEERAGEPWYPASLTKLMTAYLVFSELRSGNLRLDQEIPVSEAAVKPPPSKIGMPPGSRIKVDLALSALLVHSANDMALVLAEAVAGTEERFVAEMNRAARRLGLTGTNFANPHGLHHEQQVTTARDMGLLAATILREFPEFAHYFAEPYMRVGKLRLRNRNALLHQMPAADGMKTGYICDSGFNLVATATIDGRKLVAVVMGAKSAQARADLAQVLLEAAAATRAEPAGGKPLELSEIKNLPRNLRAPENMRELVCGGGQRVSLASPKSLAGWGVSLGRFDTPLTADAVLEARMLTTRELVPGGERGVIAAPSSKEFLALMWGMPQPDTLTLCNYLRRQNAHCEVIPPTTMAQLATQVRPASGRLVPIPRPKPKRK